MPYWDDSGRFIGKGDSDIGISLPVVGSHETNPFRREDMNEGKPIILEFDRALSDEEVGLVNETMHKVAKSLGERDKVYGLISTEDEEQVDEARPKLLYERLLAAGKEVNTVRNPLPGDAWIIFILDSGEEVRVHHKGDHLYINSLCDRLQIIPSASNAIFVRGED